MTRLTRRRLAVGSVALPAALGLGRLRPASADHAGVGAGGQDPAVALDPGTGALHLAWFRPPAPADAASGAATPAGGHGEDAAAAGAILLATSTDGGRTFGEPVAASGDDADVMSLGQCPPVVRLDGQGTTYVLYARNTAYEGVDFGRYSLRLARSGDGGATFEPAVEVFAEPVENGTYHDLLVAPDGSLHVSWLSYRQYMPGNGTTGDPRVEVRVARSEDGGRSFGPSVRVDDRSCECCRTALAADPDGTLLLAWRDQQPQPDGGDPVRNHVVARSVDRGGTWDTPTVIHDDAWRLGQCPESGPAVRRDAEGRLHAAWFTGVEGFAGVHYAVSDDDGRTFTDPTTLATADYFPHANVAMALDGAGGAWVAFDDVRTEEGAVTAVRVDRDGTVATAGAEGTTGRTPAVVAGPTGAVLAWVDGDDVRVAALGAAGA